VAVDTIEDVVEKMGQDIKRPMDRSNRSVHNIACNIKVHVLMSGKLQHLATLWSRQCWILQLLL